MEARISLHKLCARLTIALCAAFALSACSHKRTAQVERTHADTFTAQGTDSAATRDTASTAVMRIEADTIRESVTTFAVIDSSGRVKTAYVWRTREAAHAREALQAASRSTTAETKAAASERQSVQTAETETAKVTEARNHGRLWAAALTAIAVIAAAFICLRR